jgi:L-malate glycosyltransferase
LVNPGSTEDLAAAITHLAAQPALRQALGAAARQTVVEKLAPEVEYQNWLRVYEKAIARRNGKSPDPQLVPNVADLIPIEN